LRDQVGQRIGEIFIFAASETMTPHHDLAAETLVVRIERGQRGAFVRRQQFLQDGAALCVKVGGRLRPVDGVDAGGDAGGHGTVDISCGRFHGRQFRKSGSRAPPDFREFLSASLRAKRSNPELEPRNHGLLRRYRSSQ
jgi:hypothetical protein